MCKYVSLKIKVYLRVRGFFIFTKSCWTVVDGPPVYYFLTLKLFTNKIGDRWLDCHLESLMKLKCTWKGNPGQVKVMFTRQVSILRWSSRFPWTGCVPFYDKIKSLIFFLYIMPAWTTHISHLNEIFKIRRLGDILNGSVLLTGL